MKVGTAATVALAILSAIGAYSLRPQEVPPPTFDDAGELLFPDFTDANAAARLEVQTWEEASASVRTFSVELKNGTWVIPSHNDYPADASERMGQVAASFVDIRKDIVRSDNKADHPEFGVVDPLDPEAEEGRGQRVVMADAAGNELVNVIIGGDDPEREGYKFVRLGDADRVYSVQIAPDLSVNFSDWIEKDLLRFEKDEVVRVVSNSYHVDEESGLVENERPLEFILSPQLDEEGIPYEGSEEKWRLIPELAPVVPEGKELNETKVKQVFGAAARVKIAGVRRQPKPLTDKALMDKGFFLSQDFKRLFGNEGEAVIYLNDGTVYTLYFGEITYDVGLALTAGGEGEGAKDGDATKANRYMFVSVRYEQALDQGLPTHEKRGEGALRGKERVDKLRKRFENWFYVIPNSSFRQIHKDYDEFWKDVK